MSEIIRRKIQFYGAVQGVGFRYRAKHAAQNVGATGWVKNEYDGSVSMEIQGTEEQIDQVILAAEKRSYVYIMDMKVKNIRRLS
jgi:acylphosphatase